MFLSIDYCLSGANKEEEPTGFNCFKSSCLYLNVGMCYLNILGRFSQAPKVMSVIPMLKTKLKMGRDSEREGEKE